MATSRGSTSVQNVTDSAVAVCERVSKLKKPRRMVGRWGGGAVGRWGGEVVMW